MTYTVGLEMTHAGFVGQSSPLDTELQYTKKVIQSEKTSHSHESQEQPGECKPGGNKELIYNVRAKGYDNSYLLCSAFVSVFYRLL